LVEGTKGAGERGRRGVQAAEVHSCADRHADGDSVRFQGELIVDLQWGCLVVLKRSENWCGDGLCQRNGLRSDETGFSYYTE
jgi:hypothetical protein